MSDKKKLNDLEGKILNALRANLNESLIQENTALQDMLDQVKHDTEETSHHSQFRWEGIDDTYKLKVAGSPFEDDITSAFFQTHSYKYVNNPTFKLSFERELRQRAVPEPEVSNALTQFDGLVNDLSAKNPNEQDAGWNPNLEEIIDITSHTDDRNAKYTDPFTGGGLYPEGDEYDKGTLEGF